MKRDFTEEAKTTLFGLIDEINDEKSSSITDWLNNYSVFALADIEDDLGFMNAYYNKILFKNNTTKEQINTIFKNVNAVDQSYASTFSTYNQDVQEQIDYIKALADCINPDNVLFKSLASIKKQMDSVHLSFVENNSFVKTYGFTYEQYVLIKKAFSKLETYYKGDKQYINKVFNALASLCIEYNAIRWQLTTNGKAGDRFAPIKVLKEAGLTNQEITDLFVIINVQHGTSIEDLIKLKNKKELSDLNEDEKKIKELLSGIDKMGIDISKSKYLDMKPDKTLFQEEENEGEDVKKDFAHELIQFAAFSANEKSWSRNLIDIFCSGDTNYEISFKGDIDSASCKISDRISDVDAINIYERLKDNTNIFKVYKEYNKGINDGSIYRVTEFLENIGQGNAGIGLSELPKIINHQSGGSDHIQSSHPKEEIEKSKSAFMNWIAEKYLDEKEEKNKIE